MVYTNHALEQMKLRNISEIDVYRELRDGIKKKKNQTEKYWVYTHLSGRDDNLICISISLEATNIIVITTLINWSPK